MFSGESRPSKLIKRVQMRDNFLKTVADNLAKRVANHCSNPSCRKKTSGPHTDAEKAINLGVAAHITAASDGGPRYDKTLNSSQRSSNKNGIWLCQYCAKLIDNDVDRFPTELIRRWKQEAEAKALQEINATHAKVVKTKVEEEIEVAVRGMISDRDALMEYRAWFDRPALQDSLLGCGNYAGFVTALDELISLLNTGAVSRKDVTKRRNEFENERWRESLEQVYHSIRELREYYRTIVVAGNIDETKCRCSYSEISDNIDSKKFLIATDFNQILQGAGIEPIRSLSGIR